MRCGAARSCSSQPYSRRSVGGQVDAPVAVVLGDVLPVLGELQRGADRVGQLGPGVGETGRRRKGRSGPPGWPTGGSSRAGHRRSGSGRRPGPAGWPRSGRERAASGCRSRSPPARRPATAASLGASGLAGLGRRALPPPYGGVQPTQVGLELGKQPRTIGDRSPVADVIHGPREDVDRHQMSPRSATAAAAVRPGSSRRPALPATPRLPMPRAGGTVQRPRLPARAEPRACHMCPLTCHVPIRSRFLFENANNDICVT